MDIAAFLLARVADDEAAARGLWDWMIERHGPDVWSTGEGRDLGPEEWQYEADRDMTLHVSPRRVLAECEAKRLIVKAAQQFNVTPDDAGTDLVLDDVLRLLALPYAGHPAYDPAWAPFVAS